MKSSASTYKPFPQTKSTPALKIWIQPKLEINSPGDQYEQEADAMADKVMWMSQNQIPVHSNIHSPNSIQRKCSECEEEEKKKKSLMRKAESGSGGLEASPALVSKLNSTKGGGIPLPESTRQFMENAFSADFSDVRIHTDGDATEMSKNIGAKAFTNGSDIYFNNGQYQSNTKDGQRLLAHELTHRIQQKKILNQNHQNLMDCKLSQSNRFDKANKLVFLNSDEDATLFRKKDEINEDVSVRSEFQKLKSTNVKEDKYNPNINALLSPRSELATSLFALAFSSIAFDATANKKSEIEFPPQPGGGLAVKIKSGGFFVTGEVGASLPKFESNNWEVGFTQIVESGKYSAFYKRQLKNQIGAYIKTYENPPLRDALSGVKEPWSDNPKSILANKTIINVSTNDQPNTGNISCELGGGELFSLMGELNLTTWMIAREISEPNTIIFLNWISWQFVFIISVDCSTQQSTIISDDTSIIDKGNGKGLKNPVLKGPIANDSQKIIPFHLL